MKYCRGLLVFLLGVSLLYAGEPWKSKAPAKWDKDDVAAILQDSPWGKVITTGYTAVREQDKTASGGERGSTSPFDAQGGAAKQSSEFARVIWWSAHTPRRAMIRQIELGGFQVGPEQAQKFSEAAMEDHVITIEDNMARMRAAEKLTPEQLKEAAWLEIPSQKRKIACVDAGVVKDAKGQIERIRFHFPRQVDGQPLIKSDEKKIIFKWKLPTLAGGGASGKAKTEQPPAEVKLGEAKQFEASFEPKKMMVNGELDI